MAGLDPTSRNCTDSSSSSSASSSRAPAADGKIGLKFQFDADGRPADGQVQNVVGAVASGQMRTIRGKADELLATGTHGTAVVTSARHWARPFATSTECDPSRLNDPMWLFTVEVSVAERTHSRRCSAIACRWRNW